MLWQMRRNKAQIFTEHVIIYFIAIGIVVSMSIYMVRALQSRIYDARKYMINTVKATKLATGAVGKLRLEYEPYYANSESFTNREVSEQEQLLGGGRTGVFRKVFDNVTTSTGVTLQLPPVNAD